MLVRVMRCKGRTPDVAAEANFSEAGGTIGRSSQCTLALPDADRHISRIQAEVSWSGTGFLLTDRGSGNPTLRNGEAVGMGRSVPLADGDELHIGDYVLRVEWPLPRTAPRGEQRKPDEQGDPDSELASTSRNFGLAPDATALAPLAESPDAARLQDRPPAPIDPEPGDDHNAGGSIFRSWESSDGVGSTAINPGRHQENPRRRTQSAPQLPMPPMEAPPSLSTSGPAPPQERRAAEDAPLLAGLLAGIGLREAPHDPVSGKRFELDEHTMERLGKLLRLLSQGVIDLLAERTALKSDMHAAVTVIAAQGNNPLKFSPDASTALAFLLAAEPPRGFMAPEPAVEEAMSDLLAHQAGMLGGMRSALDGVLLRFEPQRLEARLAPKSLLGGVLPMNRKAKLWEQFEALYETMCSEARDDFESLFGEAVACACRQHGAAEERLPAASGAADTVKHGHAGTTGER